MTSATIFWLCAGVHLKPNSIYYMTNELCDIFGIKQMAKNSVQYELYITPRGRGVHMSEWHTLKVVTEL